MVLYPLTETYIFLRLLGKVKMPCQSAKPEREKRVRSRGRVASVQIYAFISIRVSGIDSLERKVIKTEGNLVMSIKRLIEKVTLSDRNSVEIKPAYAVSC